MKIIKIVVYDDTAQETLDRLEDLEEEGKIEFSSVEISEENY